MNYFSINAYKSANENYSFHGFLAFVKEQNISTFQFIQNFSENELVIFDQWISESVLLSELFVYKSEKASNEKLYLSINKHQLYPSFINFVSFFLQKATNDGVYTHFSELKHYINEQTAVILSTNWINQFYSSIETFTTLDKNESSHAKFLLAHFSEENMQILKSFEDIHYSFFSKLKKWVESLANLDLAPTQFVWLINQVLQLPYKANDKNELVELKSEVIQQIKPNKKKRIFVLLVILFVLGLGLWVIAKFCI